MVEVYSPQGEALDLSPIPNGTYLGKITKVDPVNLKKTSKPLTYRIMIEEWESADAAAGENAQDHNGKQILYSCPTAGKGAGIWDTFCQALGIEQKWDDDKQGFKAEPGERLACTISTWPKRWLSRKSADPT